MNGACSGATCASGQYSALGVGVDEHAVALAERAAPGVLAGEAHRGALEQRAIRTRVPRRAPSRRGRRRTRCAGAWRIRSSLGLTWKSSGHVDERVDDPVEPSRARRRSSARSRPSSGSSGFTRGSGGRHSRGSPRSARSSRARKSSSAASASASERSPRFDQRLGVELAHAAVRLDQLVHLGWVNAARRPRCGRTAGSRPCRRRRPCGTPGGTRTRAATTRTHASGSSPFTWKIGACTIFATSVA